MRLSIAEAAVTISLLLVSCKAGPRPINYGEDVCHFCWMTIVDRKHGAEAVTRKGKVYKFDSIECLLNFKKSGEVPEEEIAGYYVSDLYGDGFLLDAEAATYLKCERIPSPMGGYLSAFEDRGKAEEVYDEMGGALYNWTEMQDSFAGYLDFNQR